MRTLCVLICLLFALPAFAGGSVSLGLSSPTFKFNEINPGQTVRINQISVAEVSGRNEWQVENDEGSHDFLMLDFAFSYYKDWFGAADLSFGGDFSEFFHSRIDGYFGPYWGFLEDRLGFAPLFGGYYHHLGNSLIVVGSALTNDVGETNKLYLLRENGTDYLFTVGPHMLGSNAGIFVRLQPVKFFTVAITYLAMMAEIPLGELTKINTLPGEKRNALGAKTVVDTKGKVSRFTFQVNVHVGEILNGWPEIYFGGRRLRHHSIGFTSTGFIFGVAFSGFDL